MNSFKISTRLSMLIGVLATLMLIVGGLGLYGQQASNTTLKSVYEDRTVPAAQLGEIRALQLASRLAAATAQTDPTPNTIAAQTQLMEENLQRISTIWKAYMATYLTLEEVQLAKRFDAQRAQFVNEGLLPVASALRANDITEANNLTKEKLAKMAPDLSQTLDALIQLQINEARRGYEAEVRNYDRIQMMSIAAIAIAILFAAGFGWMMVRSITRQLGAEPGEAAAVAKAVASGDLARTITLKHGDTESLMAQLQVMQNSLAAVVGNVRTSAQGVSGASVEIAQGNADLAGRTEQQASALQETAASMEELSSTVRQTADNAAQGDALAKSAKEIATKGGEVVNRVVETMKGIDASSQRIADIIQVIDGIAFQTNILALNAAVEAARAGEQGRGFAVVATEVRSLAQRSASAAKEIKSLITGSVEQVEQGTLLVAQAGTTMAGILSSVQQVSAIMSEISAASAEQSVGVAQVSEAVSKMDQVTQQNAALVEESAAAAESLRSQAAQLVQAVALFKLAETNSQSQVQVSVRHAEAPTRSAAWQGEERRGPNRAQNVMRPVFGQRPAKTVAATREKAEGVRAGQRTGTGDWENY